MEPFVVAVGAPLDEAVPHGWALQRIGLWKGQESLVAYDPGHHAVEVTSLSLDHETVEAFRELSYAPVDTDIGGGRLLWVQDALTATRAALDRALHRTAAVEIEGLGR